MMSSLNPLHRIAVVIPCYRVRGQILDVISRIDSGCRAIYVIDDACPEQSGQFVREQCRDPRVRVVDHVENQGVGGAVLTGYAQAIKEGARIIVKVDGDGQHDPALIADFVAPLIAGHADYAKGNRFYDLDSLHQMPAIRVMGNAILSLFAKLSTGYWDLFDPTNGYTAIRAEVAGILPFDKIHKRFFFESDMLFRLSTVRAAVVDIPMRARYGDEISNLRITRIVGEFLLSHVKNTGKRVFYNYFLRNMSLASLELVFGILLIGFGSTYGVIHWLESRAAGVVTPAGTVMLAALPVMLGMQFLLAFFGYDIASVPHRARSPAIDTKSGQDDVD